MVTNWEFLRRAYKKKVKESMHPKEKMAVSLI